MKTVYTFSTGGCRDGIYLDKLSSTQEGVSNLINDYFLEVYFDRELSSIKILDKKITVWFIEDDIADKVYFDLIIFTVL